MIVPEFERLQHCGRSPVADASTVAVTLRPEGEAGFRGLQSCGSVWICPLCSERIARVRRDELNRLLAWARAQSADDRGRRLVPVMLTLTARHGVRDVLVALLGGMKQAKQKLRQSKGWRRALPLLGSVTATEMTHGGNGWHPHFHEILLVWAKDEAEAVDLVGRMRAEWMRSLGKVGLDGNGAAFQVQGAAAAGNYIAKWGVAEELALSGQKKSKGGRTPDELLEAATDGDDRAAGLWGEYARATRGRRQLVWSRGLKELAGIEEVEDEEAVAKDEVADVYTVAHIPVATWRQLAARHAQPQLLDAAEDGFERGGLLAAEAALWQVIRRILAPPGGAGTNG